jgi:peptide/nickel transport system permease protein
MFGARISLSIGLLAVLLSMLVGLPLGLISGYQGGSVEDVVMRGMDILLAMPSIILAIAIVAAVGPSLAGVVVAIAISSIPGIVRLARAQTLAVKRLEYVEAARALGAGSRRIMLRHILPNVIGTLVVQATLNVGFAILVEAGLSFLGLGVQPPTPTWGGMVSEGRKYIFTAAYIGIVPGVFIMFASLACNLVGDSLRDALDPRSKLRTGG